ncbi:MAG TPA: hypothetical protein VF545_09575 [Thermoleophilaceae bacterium]|jgi:hypothetical protein
MSGDLQHQAARLQELGRLSELGVAEDVLREAVQVGQHHASDCTAHDPRGLSGILVWGKTVRELRDRLVPLGWRSSDDRNYATVVNPVQTFAIAVAGGDVNTGRRGAEPSTRTDKGPATQDAVKLNRQLSFSDIDQSFPKFQPEGPGLQTWMLLHHADEDAQEIRVELSLPAGMTGGLVTDWQERIVLSPVPFMPHAVEVAEPDDHAIDIRIDRRA